MHMSEKIVYISLSVILEGKAHKINSKYVILLRNFPWYYQCYVLSINECIMMIRWTFRVRIHNKSIGVASHYFNKIPTNKLICIFFSIHTIQPLSWSLDCMRYVSQVSIFLAKLIIRDTMRKLSIHKII